MLGLIYKLPGFLLKLDDVQTEDIRSEYQKKVIFPRLSSAGHNSSWLEQLTDELSLARDLKYLREWSDIFGRISLLLTIIALVLFSLWGSGALVEPFSTVFLVLAVLAGMMQLTVLVMYYYWLTQARAVVVSMREKIYERETSATLSQGPQR